MRHQKAAEASSRQLTLDMPFVDFVNTQTLGQICRRTCRRTLEKSFLKIRDELQLLWQTLDASRLYCLHRHPGNPLVKSSHPTESRK